MAVHAIGRWTMRVTRLRTQPRLGIAVASVLLLSLAAGVSGAATGSAATKPVLNIGLTYTNALDPTQAGQGPGNLMLSLAYAPLIHWSADGSLKPGLATSWHYFKTPAGAHKGFEVMLRRNARFSDGTPVTAAAVKTWLEYFSHAKGSPSGAAVTPIKSIETVGKWTVRIRLLSPDPIMPYALSDGLNWGFVASPQKVLGQPESLATQTAGAGPYQLDMSQSVANHHYTFVPNPYFYDKSQVRWSKVVVYIIANSATMLQALQAGQLDVAKGDVATVDAAAGAGFQVYSAPAGTASILFLDRGGALAPPLGDPRVRQALNYAIDRKAITAALMGKFGTPTSEISTIDGWDPKLRAYYNYDPAKARSLLAAAGYPNGFKFNVADNGCAGTTGSPVTQAVAKYLGAINVQLDIATDCAGFFAKAVSGTFAGLTLTRGGDSMWLYYGLFLKPGGALNQHGWDDPVMDRLWVAASRAADPSAYFKKMTQRVVTQADQLPVFTYPNIYYVSKHVGGFKLTGAQPVSVFLNDWFPKT